MATKPTTPNLEKSSPVPREPPQPVEQLHQLHANGSSYVGIKLQQLKHPGFHSPYPDKKCFVEIHEQLVIRGINTETSSSVDRQYYDRIMQESTGSYWVDYATFTSVDEYAERPFKQLVSRFAESVVPATCPGCGSKAELFMHIDYQYGFDEAAIIAWAEQESTEQETINMVPTQEAVIEGLNKECLQDDDCSDQQCMICLDEFTVGSEVSKLPCSHVYHWICIVEWLKTSHFCPTCRYCFPCLGEENVLASSSIAESHLNPMEENEINIYAEGLPPLRLRRDSHPSLTEEGDSPVS